MDPYRSQWKTRKSAVTSAVNLYLILSEVRIPGILIRHRHASSTNLVLHITLSSFSSQAGNLLILIPLLRWQTTSPLTSPLRGPLTFPLMGLQTTSVWGPIKFPLVGLQTSPVRGPLKLSLVCLQSSPLGGPLILSGLAPSHRLLSNRGRSSLGNLMETGALYSTTWFPRGLRPKSLS